MPAKTPLFSCAKCGAQFSKWAGRCTECGGWGTVKEETTDTSHATHHASSAKPGNTHAFTDLAEASKTPHLPTNFAPWDRLLSGGLVAGSVTLLGGEPGIGKSTLLAQLALTLARQGKNVLYATGEESPFQVSVRLRRLTTDLPSTLEFLDDMRADVIAATIENKKPALTIIDSMQTMRLADIPGEPGNPTQLKACVATVTEAAKKSHAPVILVGQVTKDGDLAGPRLVEHLVDTVIMLEGDRDGTTRLLRPLKHRFGATDDLVLFRMTEQGLEEILDPSAALLADRPKNTAGVVVTCLADTSRPILVEIQALVTPAGYGTPLRRATGIDTNRLSLLLAVLGRKAGVSFADQDVFVNAVGGISAKEPAVDLALCLALASAKFDIPLPPDLAAWGEVGLSGELRPVSRQAGRTKEAGRLGFSKLITSKDYGTLRELLDKLGLKKSPS